MKTKKNFALRALSVFLCLLLTLSTVLVAGVFSTAAGAEEGIYLRGNMNGWNCYEQYKFVDEGNGIYTLVLDMTGGNYEFKIATPTWSVSIGNETNDNDNAHLVIEADSIIKFTADTNTRNYTAESMNEKSDFTLGTSAQTIEAEQYTYALGAVNVWEDAAASSGKYVGAFDEGDSLNYGVTVAGDKAQAYKFEIYVACEADSGVFDFTAGTETFYSHFGVTGAWQTYKTVVVTKTLNPGYNRITIDNIAGTYNVDKIVATPVEAADTIATGKTTLDLKNFDAASDAALIKNGTFTNAKEEEYVSLIVKPELDGVYTVNIGTEADIIVNDFVYENGDNIVIEGETELLIYATQDNTTVKNISFEYINNVELMGYMIYDDVANAYGYRFANTFAIDRIIIGANTDIGAGKIVLSNGKEIAVDAVADGAETFVNFDVAENITWFTYVGEDAAFADLQVIGTKVMDSATDIALDGYVSISGAWDYAMDVPYATTTATEGKIGFGFDKEVTVEKIVVIGADDSIPAKATLTTADNKKVELTGTKKGNDVIFEIEDSYSFGFYLDFGKEINYAAIQAYGDDTFKGATKNVSGAQDYTLFANGLTEDDSRVIANTGYHILTSETGSDREWEYNPFTTANSSEDKDNPLTILDAPTFYAPNTPLAEAAYNLTMEEIYKSINYDETYGDVFYTGTNWHKVWTRDTAISMQYILSWLFPEISENCADAKVVGTNGNYVFEEDTGTGGSYPVSTDRIIMMLAVWETYLANGNEETLEKFYEVASNTITQDLAVVYDKEAGLFRGETCGLDHRDKTYGDWTGENDQNGIVAIAEGKATSTNIIYCQAMKILAESAQILGKDAQEAKAWADLAADLEEAISTRLWHEELGTYTSWEYPDWMGSPLAYKQDVLADGYAVWYNIGGDEKSNSIMENHTLVPFGANTVYPNKNAERWTDYKYHDSGVWPGWEALLMIGAVNHKDENNLLAEEIWNSCVRGAVSCLTNYEVIDYETGEGLHSTQQLWSVAATMAGYYRVLFGMEYTTDGITFDPYVPQWMEGPFYVDNYKYRDANLSLELYGKGDTVKEIYVNDEKVANDYVFPTDAKGDYFITIYLEDSGAEDTVNLKVENTTKAPTAPAAKLSGTTLSWNAVENCTYKVWTGTEYVDVDTTSYTVDASKYGVYSVVAVDKTTGLWSELSQPSVFNPVTVKVNVGNVVDNLSALKGAQFKVTVPADGEYQMYAIHNNTNVGDPTSSLTAAIRSVYVDGKDVGTLVFPVSNFQNQNSSHLRLTLTKGEHTVEVKYDTADWFDTNMSESRDEYKHNDVTYKSFVFDLVDGDFSGGVTPPPADVKPEDVELDGTKYPIFEGYNTIVYSAKSDWEKAYIYAWGDSGNNGEWPGVEMKFVVTNDYGENIFVAYVPKEFGNYIISNGSGEQTVDLSVDKSLGMYMAEKNEEGKWTIGEWTPEFYEYVAPTQPTQPTQPSDPVTQPSAPAKDIILGDADGNGIVNVKDATSIQKHVAELITLSEDGIVAADSDGNGTVNVKDATAIQKHIAGMETGFDIEQPIK
ncbi:MAG: starch-binding protein [Ruminococcus sp.]|nr:starch-binding protein [Ruminococcus sp.]